MTIAVFGSTGQLGALVLDALVARGVAAQDVLALGRDEARLAAAADRGFPTGRVDLDDLDPAVLDGVEQVLLISALDPGRRVAQHGAVIDAARAAGARHVVYTSAPHASTSALVLAPDHRATEQLLTASGLDATVLRNNWYTENYRPDFDRARATGVIANSVGDGQIASAPRADYAEAAAVVLTTAGHEGRLYELSGDVAWTWEQFAATAAAVLGREVVYEPLSREQEADALRAAGLDAGTVGFVGALNEGIRDGALADATADLRTLLGRPTVPLADTLRAWAAHA